MWVNFEICVPCISQIQNKKQEEQEREIGEERVEEEN
jgi:hypothetical protein